MVDYGTRYPEAVPLRSTDSAAVATALMGIFTGLGVPKEVLTDQGSNFLSSLIEELYRMLETLHLKTSPYHPQTNGAVEKFHGTLKHMLRKTTTDKRDWDTVLPYVLFAFRKVPCASTGLTSCLVAMSEAAVFCVSWKKFCCFVAFEECSSRSATTRET